MVTNLRRGGVYNSTPATGTQPENGGDASRLARLEEEITTVFGFNQGIQDEKPISLPIQVFFKDVRKDVA